ncbi:MAG: hypothetical protein EP330_00830 [Deltaproteobacteria bacterium]|nr:MAG: hypothetical protein EP330_00830 [Deltaproteobacteria bacterium]
MTLDGLDLRLGQPSGRFGTLFSLGFVCSGALVLGLMCTLDLPVAALAIMLVIGVSHLALGSFGFVTGASGLRVNIGLERIDLAFTVLGRSLRAWSRPLTELDEVRHAGAYLEFSGPAAFRVWTKPLPQDDVKALEKTLNATIQRLAVNGTGSAPAELLELFERALDVR